MSEKMNLTLLWVVSAALMANLITVVYMVVTFNW